MRLGKSVLLALTFMVASLGAGGSSQARGGEGGAGSQAVTYDALPLPIIVDGRLVNYVFIVLRLTPRSSADATLLKEREPFVRDRLLRLGYTQPFVRPGDLTHVDERRVVAAITGEADRLIGPKLLGKVDIASQTPQRRTGLGPPVVQRTIIP